MPNAAGQGRSTPGLNGEAWRIVFGASVGAFLTSFDAGAINAVLPLIRQAFGRGIAEVQWVLAVDLLVASSLVLVCGRLGDRFGFRPVYLGGFAVFVGGCLLCAIAPTLSWLIAFRALQGIGTAMLLVSSPSVLIRHTPAARRGSGFGVKASALYLGLAMGPLLAGWLGARLGWRWAFVMEVPAALMGVAIAAVWTPPDPPSVRNQRFVLGRAWLWSGGVISLLWLLRIMRTGRMIRWDLAVVVVLVGIAAGTRRRELGGLFRSSRFQGRAFSASVLSLGVGFAASYMLTFALPMLLLEARNEGASMVGRLLALYALSRCSVAWCSGRWSDRIEPWRLTVSGLMIFSCGAVLLSNTDRSTPIFTIAAALGLAGLGFGCFVPPNNSTLMVSAPRERQGFAAGILITVRTLGMTIGVTVAGAILSTGGGSLVSRIDLVFRVAALFAAVSAITSAFARSRRPASESVPVRMNPSIVRSAE